MHDDSPPSGGCRQGAKCTISITEKEAPGSIGIPHVNAAGGKAARREAVQATSVWTRLGFALLIEQPVKMNGLLVVEGHG
jgi:hypothetical protein